MPPSCLLRLPCRTAVQVQRNRRYYSQEHYGLDGPDVVIVGGGPVGLSLASALASSEIVRQNLRVALVEGGDLSRLKQWSPSQGTYSNRVSSLTNTSQTFFKDIGVWDYVETQRTTPIEEMQVWDGISDARITFSSSELGLSRPEEGMARLTENVNLQRALLRHLDQYPEVELIEKTKVATIVRDKEERGGWPLVHLENGRILRTRLLIGADGFNSPVRSYAKIASFGWSYDTHGVVATMNHQPRSAFEPPNTTAYQRFLTTGPIAFLPLSPTVSSLVWSTKPKIAAALLASEPNVLTSMINAAFRLPSVSLRYLHDRILEAHAQGTPLTHSELQQEILWREQSHAIDPTSAYASATVVVNKENVVPPADAGCIPPLVTSIQSGTMASFPLRFSHTEAYLGEGHGGRSVLVGDAAHTVHPLAGQGLNMGIADVECLSRCIQNALVQGGDIGSYTALLPYSRERYIENHALMGAIDKLHKIFSAEVEPIVWARTVGLEVLNEVDSVKAAFMMAAGARSEKLDTRAAAWNLAAKGVETAAVGVNAARMIGRAIAASVGSQVQKILSQSR